MKHKEIHTILIFILLAATTFVSGKQNAHAQSYKITFAVIGDYGMAGKNEEDVANLVKSWNPDFIVTTGDNNYPDGAAWSIDDNIGQYYHDYIFQYSGKYGNGSAARRFFPSLGNHDWDENSGRAYFNYFTRYKEEPYYDFIQGPVHFFVLNSNKSEPDGVTSTSTQAKWLKKSLAASTSPFNVIVFHHPAYSSGRHGSNTYMQWPFKEWGADAILNGHDHVYERLIVDGIPYFVNGIGGAELYYFDPPLPESRVRFNQNYGAMFAEATDTYMKFQTFSRTGALIDEYTIGENFPTVTSINLLGQTTTNANSLSFQVTFSESVTGVDATDFIITSNLSGATIESVNGSGNSYIVSVNSGTGDGTLRLDLTDDDSVTNSLNSPLGGLGAGNGSFTSGQTYIVDKTPPAVTAITLANPNPTNAQTVDFTIAFSEPVTGVDLSDFVLSTNTGASLISINGSDSLYTITASTNPGDDLLRLDFVSNGSVIDLAGNTTNLNFVSGETYTVDRSTPYVTSIVPAGGSASSVDFIVSFSESVSGVDETDFFVSTTNGAYISNLSGYGNLYTVTLSVSIGNDSIRLDLIDNSSIYDNFGNMLSGGFTNGETYVIDWNAPMVTSITRVAPDPTNAASVDFMVTFSEPVDGVDTADFIVSGMPDAFITNINNTDPYYVVTVSTGTGDGTLRLDLNDNDSIHNFSGIPLGGEGFGNASFTGGETYSIDRTPPQVTSIVRAGNNPAITSVLDFIVTFSEPVFNVGTSDFSVSTGNFNSSVTNIQDANPFFVVSVNSGAGSGDVRLDLIDNFSITDIAGNSLSNGSFISGESFMLAKIPVRFSAPNLQNTKKYSLTNNPLPYISWSSVRKAIAYEVFISTDSYFSSLIFSKTTNGTNIIPDFPLPDATYYVRVRAYNSLGQPGKFSKSASFTIDTTPHAALTLISPADNSSTTNRPSLKWQSVDGWALYEIQVDNNSDFSSPEFSEFKKKSDTRTRSLPKGLTYFWRVRAQDKAGNWSEWSPPSVFIVP